MKKLSLKQILSLTLMICLTVNIMVIIPPITGCAVDDNYIEEFETVASTWATFKETYPGWTMSDESQISSVSNHANDPRVATVGEFRFSSNATADFDDLFITKIFDSAYTSDEVIFETKVKANSGNAPRKSALTINGDEGTLVRLNLVSGNSATTGTFSYTTEDSGVQEIDSDTYWGTDYVTIKIVISKSTVGRENPYDTCYYYIGDLENPAAGGTNHMIDKTQTSVNGFSLVWQDSTGSICVMFYDYFKVIGTKDALAVPQMPPLVTESDLCKTVFSYDFDTETNWSNGWELIPGDNNSIDRFVEDGNGMMRFSAGSTTQLVARLQKKLKDIEEATGLTMPKLVLEYRVRMNDVGGTQGVFCGETATQNGPARGATPVMYAKKNGSFVYRFGRDDNTEFATFTPNQWDTITIVYDNLSTTRTTYLNGVKQGETASDTGNGYYNTGGDFDIFFRLNETDSGRIADVDYVTLYAYPESLEFEVEAESSTDTNSINLIFNERLSSAGLTKSMISVDNGSEVNKVKMKDGKYIVEFVNPLQPLSTYNITLNGVSDIFEHTITDMSKSFSTRKPMLYMDKSELIDDDAEQKLTVLQSGNLKVTFSASNETDKNEALSVLVPIYDENENMTALYPKDITLNDGVVNFNDYVAFSLNDISQAERLSVFAWKNKSLPIPVSGNTIYTSEKMFETPANKSLPEYNETPVITTDIDNDKICVTVETMDANPREVGLLVEADGETFYATQKTSVDGVAEFKFNARYPKAKFCIKAGIYGAASAISDEIEYYSNGYIEESFNKINNSSATKEDIKTFITELDEVHSLDTTAFSKLSVNASDHLCSVILSERNSCENGKFADIDDFKKALSIASIMGLILDKKNVDAALKDSSEYLEDSAYGIYESMSETCRTCVIDAVSGEAYFSTEELSSAFSKQVVFQGIYKAEHYMLIRDIVISMAEEIGLDLVKYNAIEDKRPVDIGLMGNLFDKYQDVISKFNSLVASMPENPSGDSSSGDDNNSGSTGGGGSSGGGGYYFPGGYNTSSTTEPLAPTPLYKDIDGYAWAEDAILALSEKGILSGDGNGLFRPEAPVTRAEFIKMILLAANLYSEDATGVFRDVSENDWYYPYVASAKYLGLVNGDADGCFGGNKVIKREDMATILHRVLIHKNNSLPKTENTILFTDNDSISEYSREAVYSIRETGIINGVGDNRFAPLEPATRAQAAKMIYNFLSIESGEN